MVCLVSAHELALGVEAGAAERGGFRVSGRRRAAHRAVLHAEGLHLGRVREHNRRGENAAGRAQVGFGKPRKREGSQFRTLVSRSNGITLDMDASGSMTAVQNTLDRLGTQRDELGDLWNTRKLRLDLCLQLRLFERDAVEVRTF